MRTRPSPPIAALLAAATMGAAAVIAPLTAGAAAAASCPAVNVVFARGTGEFPGLGITGGPFVSSLTSDLKGKSVSSYAVNYAAAADQSSAGAGSTDMVSHVKSVAASCPSTKFVLGGYSQGATVVDKALGITTATGGFGTALPSSLAQAVAAVVVFGNPLGLQGQTIERVSATYGARAKSYCNFGDPVCGNGFDAYAHLLYAYNGSTSSGASFAATKITN